MVPFLIVATPSLVAITVLVHGDYPCTDISGAGLAENMVCVSVKVGKSLVEHK